MSLLLVLDLIGTFVFAISGAVVGVTRRLDLFGTLVLSYAAANIGGIARDLLIGSVPPAAVSDWRYLVASLLAGAITFCGPSAVDRLSRSVLIFDAAGLALFAVSGTQKALAFGLHPVMAALLGMLTGIGGVSRVICLWPRSPLFSALKSMPSQHWRAQRPWSSGSCCNSRRA